MPPKCFSFSLRGRFILRSFSASYIQVLSRIDHCSPCLKKIKLIIIWFMRNLARFNDGLVAQCNVQDVNNQLFLMWPNIGSFKIILESNCRFCENRFHNQQHETFRALRYMVFIIIRLQKILTLPYFIKSWSSRCNSPKTSCYFTTSKKSVASATYSISLIEAPVICFHV